MSTPEYKSIIHDLSPEKIAKLAITRNILHAPRWKRFQERLWYDPVLNAAAWCFRPELFNFVLYMHTFDTVPDGIRESLGVSDPYFIPTSVEDFLVRTSPLFSNQFQNQIRDRCQHYDGSFLGQRTKDGFVCTSNVLYAAVRLTHEILSYYKFKPYETMFAELDGSRQMRRIGRYLDASISFSSIPGWPLRKWPPLFRNLLRGGTEDAKVPEIGRGSVSVAGLDLALDFNVRSCAEGALMSPQRLSLEDLNASRWKQGVYYWKSMKEQAFRMSLVNHARMIPRVLVFTALSSTREGGRSRRSRYS